MNASVFKIKLRKIFRLKLINHNLFTSPKFNSQIFFLLIILHCWRKFYCANTVRGESVVKIFASFEIPVYEYEDVIF